MRSFTSAARVKYLLYKLGSGTLSPLAYVKRFLLAEGGEANARADFETALRIVGERGFDGFRGDTRTIVEANFERVKAHNYEGDAGWTTYFSEVSTRSGLTTQVRRGHVAIGEMLTRQYEAEVQGVDVGAVGAVGAGHGDAAGEDGEGEASGSRRKRSTPEEWADSQTKKARETVDLRDGQAYTSEQLEMWAQDSPIVQGYIDRARVFMGTQDVGLKQRGRHLLRLLKSTGVLEKEVLETVWAEMPQLSVMAATVPRAYDVKGIRRAFSDDPPATRLVQDMVRENVLVRPTSLWAWWKNGPELTKMTQASVWALIGLAVKMPTAAALDEQDVRSVWANAIRMALPCSQESGIGISLEFQHDFELDDDTSTTKKSDVTIYVTGSSIKMKKVGECILEVAKEEPDLRGGCVHKDHIKTPGEVSQQIISLLSATWVGEDDLKNIHFHYGLVSKWTAQCFVVKVVWVDAKLWFVQTPGPRFTIGSTAKGAADLLRFGEYLHDEVMPACMFVNELLARKKGPNVELVESLPKMRPATLFSRVSTAPFTPGRKAAR
ncbi:hypothetical protein DFS34DRAFT_670446 [Phlyctochytrium arcticum]|nr:hypothetical protein DFS34DRAFT_670446 [Phlyctochytrium arcticum]